MPIPITCDCGRSMRLKDELAGKKVRCPGCASVISVPALSSENVTAKKPIRVALELEQPSLSSAPKQAISAAIAVACECGRSMRVRPELAGKKIRCPACAVAIRVPEPLKPAADEDASQFLLDDQQTPAATPSWRKANEDTAEAVRAVPTVYQAQLPVVVPKQIAPEKRGKSIRKKKRTPTSGFVIEPQVITGIFMMLGAVVWFFGALYLGRIFIYPPIMFFGGLGALIRGIRGLSDV